MQRYFVKKKDSDALFDASLTLNQLNDRVESGEDPTSWLITKNTDIENCSSTYWISVDQFLVEEHAVIENRPEMLLLQVKRNSDKILRGIVYLILSVVLIIVAVERGLQAFSENSETNGGISIVGGNDISSRSSEEFRKSFRGSSYERELAPMADAAERQESKKIDSIHAAAGCSLFAGLGAILFVWLGFAALASNGPGIQPTTAARIDYNTKPTSPEDY